MKGKVLIFTGIISAIFIAFYSEIMEVFNAVYSVMTTPVFWKINPFMIGIWVVYKFHKYLWNQEVDPASEEIIGEYKTLNEAEFKTKKYIRQNYDEGFNIEKFEEFDRTKGWKYSEFAITVMHGICKVIFIPIKRD